MQETLLVDSSGQLGCRSKVVESVFSRAGTGFGLYSDLQNRGWVLSETGMIIPSANTIHGILHQGHRTRAKNNKISDKNSVMEKTIGI